MHIIGSIVAAVLLVVAWMLITRAKSEISAVAGWVLCGAAVVGAVAFTVLTSWVAAIPMLFGALVLAVCANTAKDLMANRAPDSATVALLRSAGATPLEGGAAQIGSLWQTANSTYCVAMVDDHDVALEMWLRAASKSCEDGTVFVAVAKGAERRTYKSGGVQATVCDPSHLRKVLHPKKRKK